MLLFACFLFHIFLPDLNFLIVLGYCIAKNTKPTEQGEFIKWHNIPFNKIQTVEVKGENGKKETVARILPMSSKTSCNVMNKIETEKTILIVGVTGAGKSTLIDAIVNFIFNVRYEDRWVNLFSSKFHH